MVKKRTEGPRRPATDDRFPLIERELRKRTQAELAAMVLAVAKEHDAVARDLEDRLAIEKPAEALVADVSPVMDRATGFVDRMMHRNFDADWSAYEDVHKGLSRLAKLGRLAEAKSLALTLMKDGSYQVACSDEGMMREEIGGRLAPAIKAAKAAGGVDAATWAAEMQKVDQARFICRKELAKLRGQS